jgi:glucosamine--fructose-6-phosphate aminotransferase (isomerizing)
VSDMDTEIREQPGIVASLAAADSTPYGEVCRAAKSAHVQFVLYIGRGTSDNAAVYGQYLTATRAGLPSGLALPSATTLYEAELNLRHSLVIAISQSGETPDVAETLAYAQTQGALTVAVTNNISSPLASAASWALPTSAGIERAVAATKTYTAELAVLALLWATWADDRSLLADLRETVPAAMQQALESSDSVNALAPGLVDSEQLLVVARGYNLATALETSLKIQETAGISALAYSGADLMHGPIAMLDPGMPVICFAPSGKTQGSMLQVISTLRGRGVRIVLVAPESALALLDPNQRPGSQTRKGRRKEKDLEWVPLMEVQEVLSPLVAIIPGQLLACNLAVARRRDPDRPRGLSKVTHTR